MQKRRTIQKRSVMPKHAPYQMLYVNHEPLRSVPTKFQFEAAEIRAILMEAQTQIVGDLCRGDDGEFQACGTETAQEAPGSTGAPAGTGTLPDALAAKIARREPGKGGPVALDPEELRAILDHGTFGSIGAGANPQDPVEAASWTPAKEAARKDAIHRDLVAKGYVFTDGRGRYGTEEDSIFVFVPNAERQDLIEIGKRHNQDSVIYSDHRTNELIYTVGQHAGKRHVGQGWQPVSNDAGDYYTEIPLKGGSKLRYILNLDFDHLVEHYRRRFRAVLSRIHEAHHHPESKAGRRVGGSHPPRPNVEPVRPTGRHGAPVRTPE